MAQGKEQVNDREVSSLRGFRLVLPYTDEELKDKAKEELRVLLAYFKDSTLSSQIQKKLMGMNVHREDYHARYTKECEAAWSLQKRVLESKKALNSALAYLHNTVKFIGLKVLVEVRRRNATLPVDIFHNLAAPTVEEESEKMERGKSLLSKWCDEQATDSPKKVDVIKRYLRKEPYESIATRHLKTGMAAVPGYRPEDGPPPEDAVKKVAVRLRNQVKYWRDHTLPTYLSEQGIS